MSFFNSTKESGQLLLEYREQGKRQDDLVLRAYQIKGKLTPSECHCWLVGSKEIPEDTPLTSIRRSITVLSQKDEDGIAKLEKTKEKGRGRYGRGEYYWRLFS